MLTATETFAPPSDADAEAAPNPPPRPGLCVLVVDDDAFQRALLSELLGELGVRTVLLAEDGRAGIAAYDAARPRPDAVISDLCMPGQDGFELLDALAARRFGGGLILMSGQETRLLQSARLMAQFHQLQLLAALPKPVSRLALCQALERLY
ncbi:response regulator [Rugamonas sp. CCM 8940]|uniref:response regulator n=1 Tax=Rugamonas sp. CCM 8940 TaxID=2765359 RepID=UPI0018F4163B|nr:response regulator [Rugamonas sp. CCM 8940]MBJ7308916.1 response regulator [Rugamonas sp. CCM 8940]